MALLYNFSDLTISYLGMKRGTYLIITMEDYTEPTGLIGITHYVPILEPFIELNYTYVIVIDTNISHTQILNNFNVAYICQCQPPPYLGLPRFHG